MIIVADAGPILHLHWVGATSWGLPDQAVHVVEAVWIEISAHAPDALRDNRLVRAVAPAKFPFDASQLSLEPGEASALAFALTQSTPLLLTDDAAARRACAQLQLASTGTLGLILGAAHAARTSRDEAARALVALPTIGRMHVSAELIASVVSALPHP